MPSYTTLDGRYCLRLAISTHLATYTAFDRSVDALLEMVPDIEAR